MIEIFDENRFDKFRIVDMQSRLRSLKSTIHITILFYMFSTSSHQIL